MTVAADRGYVAVIATSASGIELFCALLFRKLDRLRLETPTRGIGMFLRTTRWRLSYLLFSQPAGLLRAPLSVKAVVVINTISTSPKITCGSRSSVTKSKPKPRVNRLAA